MNIEKKKKKTRTTLNSMKNCIIWHHSLNVQYLDILWDLGNLVYPPKCSWSNTLRLYHSTTIKTSMWTSTADSWSSYGYVIIFFTDFHNFTQVCHQWTLLSWKTLIYTGLFEQVRPELFESPAKACLTCLTIQTISHASKPEAGNMQYGAYVDIQSINTDKGLLAELRNLRM